MNKKNKQRDFSEELQTLLKSEGTSWAEAAHILGKERSNIRRNVRRWLSNAEFVLNALGYTITIQKKAIPQKSNFKNKLFIKK
jgi:transposase